MKSAGPSFCVERGQGYFPPCSEATKIIYELAESFGRAIDAKDPFTKNHSDQVAMVSHVVALALGLPGRMANVILIAGHLHDIGKIGVPMYILNNTGRLSEEDWGMVRKHPATGEAILEPVSALTGMGVPELVLCHHERFDGQGYPRGLAGREIPLGARIIAVADSLSAMLQRRPYRMALDFDDACEEVSRCAGSQFDPEVVAAFLSVREPARQMMLYAGQGAQCSQSLDEAWGSEANDALGDGGHAHIVHPRALGSLAALMEDHGTTATGGAGYGNGGPAEVFRP